jgi:CTP synthase (UTP-ammonia lyase)
VIGDRRPEFVAQDAIESALAHSANELRTQVEVIWFPTALLSTAANDVLSGVDALWCAPGSPYESMEGALAGIRVARESLIPFLGTCAGFQHGVIEFARNVAGIEGAHHGEYATTDPTPPLLIDELLCSLVGQTMTIDILDEATRDVYGSARADENYYCRFGLNESYVPTLRAAGLVVAAADRIDGSTRVMRLVDHPCFYLTLFVPQNRSTQFRPHPLITRYLSVALLHRQRTRPPAI